MADEKSDKGFSVVDRRVTSETEQNESAEPEEKNPKTGSKPEQEALPQADPKTSQDPCGESSLPPVSFPTFLLSLHTSALIHLGVLPDPMSGEEHLNLEIARQNIDLLEILKAKTRGNLSEEEDKLLENILYELRMAYLEICQNLQKKENS